jgi:hypothetical protein
MRSGSGVPVICPSIGSIFRRPLPSTGSHRERFPRFVGTTRRSDAHSFDPPHFVFLRLAVPLPCVRCFVISHGGRTPRPRAWSWSPGTPPGDSRTEMVGPPRFLGDPPCTCPALRPRWDLASGHCDVSVLPSAVPRASAPTMAAFGAHSHGLCARCLRFAAGVTPRRRKTRFWLLASFARRGWLPAGSHYEVSGALLTFASFLLIQALPGALELQSEATLLPFSHFTPIRVNPRKAALISNTTYNG